MFRTKDKIAVTITDPVTKCIDVILKGIGSSLKDRYSTLDEVGTDVNSAFQNIVQGVQDNYNRVYKEITTNPSKYGIEIIGGDDSEGIVNEHAMQDGAENENQNDPFATQEEQNAGNVNVNDVFNDEDDTQAVVPQ